jgi:hypothetical protein
MSGHKCRDAKIGCSKVGCANVETQLVAHKSVCKCWGAIISANVKGANVGAQKSGAQNRGRKCWGTIISAHM